jgi:hypothetical protein
VNGELIVPLDVINRALAYHLFDQQLLRGTSRDLTFRPIRLQGPRFSALLAQLGSQVQVFMTAVGEPSLDPAGEGRVRLTMPATTLVITDGTATVAIDVFTARVFSGVGLRGINGEATFRFIPEVSSASLSTGYNLVSTLASLEDIAPSLPAALRPRVRPSAGIPSDPRVDLSALGAVLEDLGQEILLGYAEQVARGLRLPVYTIPTEALFDSIPNGMGNASGLPVGYVHVPEAAIEQRHGVLRLRGAIGLLARACVSDEDCFCDSLLDATCDPAEDLCIERYCRSGG